MSLAATQQFAQSRSHFLKTYNDLFKWIIFHSTDDFSFSFYLKIELPKRSCAAAGHRWQHCVLTGTEWEEEKCIFGWKIRWKLGFPFPGRPLIGRSEAAHGAALIGRLNFLRRVCCLLLLLLSEGGHSFRERKMGANVSTCVPSAWEPTRHKKKKQMTNKAHR